MTPPAWVTAVYLVVLAVMAWFVVRDIDDGDDDA